MRRALGLPPNRSEQPALAPGESPATARRMGLRTPAGGRATDPAGTNRLATAEAALNAEREAHQKTLRTLQDAQAALQSSETRRAHAELARDEALEALARLRAERDAPPAPEPPPQLAAEQPEPVAGSWGEWDADEAEPADAGHADAEPEGAEEHAAAEPSPEPPVKRRRGRPPGRRNAPAAPAAAEEEAEPVQWWTPGWQQR